MNAILELPELIALNGPAGLVRIPNQIDVPVTPRVLALIDTPEFQRLAQISQLGVVAFVYPAANHNRFEHSLGVYRMSLLFLQHLAHQPRFVEVVSARDATLLILAALLHDIGHWPFCHPIEDLRLPNVPSHEQFAAMAIRGENIATILTRDWAVDPQEVIDLINGRLDTPAGKILGSILSGPIDIDKMDYLYRDSLHAGVPYGQNFDSPRLIRSLCLNEAGDRLAITHKGKTAAELMVFARYVMFSEVYWHHAVRSATSMLQRAFYLWYEQHHDAKNKSSMERLLGLSEGEMIAAMGSDVAESVQDGTRRSERDAGLAKEAQKLINHLFGRRRRLFKRAASYSFIEGEAIYRELARRPYSWLVNFGLDLGTLITRKTGVEVLPHQILIDAPPVGLEVQFNVSVYYEKENRYRNLGEVSPVVQTLATRQFDDLVKQVRIFVDPDLLPMFREISMDACVEESLRLS